MTNEKVEVHPAYVWDCPECGVENFERAAVLDLPDDEKLELMHKQGILEPYQTLDDMPEGEGGLFMSQPQEVDCRECGKHYDTEYMTDPKSEDDE